ncbi:MAG: class I SAM-dependent methyltransferase [Streptosporangiaceae bacterium]|nr:class I SAM-dependent methyltransferase [Streptosporangiaceae bacterium]MBV9857563.1 class I SAM-dependent methyltransferase [Streptosporangiaceae bacterium]
MTSPAPPLPAPPATTSASRQRWEELLGSISGLLPAGPASVLIDGHGPHPAILAGRLAAALNAAGQPCWRPPGTGRGTATGASPCIPVATIMLADGARWRHARRWDVVIWLRTPAAGCPAGGDGETGADIVIDLHDPGWPVIRRVAAPLAGRGTWYITETRAFFASRAATWDTKFGDDLPAYAAAIAEAGIPANSTVIDLGCGTGRALAALRQAAGPHGKVIAIDLTPEMLRQARDRAQTADAALILADARHLPLASASADAIFAAGLIMHLPDPEAGLRQLARITRPGGLLILFHPSGRAALAARHGRSLTPGEPLDHAPLHRSTRSAGWQLTTYDDAGHRFLAIATRRP